MASLSYLCNGMQVFLLKILHKKAKLMGINFAEILETGKTGQVF